MAKRPKDDVVIHNVKPAPYARLQRAREGLALLEHASSLTARTHLFVVAMARFQNGPSIVRSLGRGAEARKLREASGATMRVAAGASRARENLQPVVLLSRLVESGNPREARALNVSAWPGANQGRGKMSSLQTSPSNRDGARDDRKEHEARREHQQYSSKLRGRKRNPGAEMHQTVRRAIDVQRGLAGASRSAVLTRALNDAWEVKWYHASHPYELGPEQADGITEHRRDSRERQRGTADRIQAEGATSNHGRIHEMVARFARTIRSLPNGLRGTRMASDRVRGLPTALTRGQDRSATERLAAVIRIPAGPTFVPVRPEAANRRAGSGNPSSAAPIVINSSPTLVVNRGDSTFDLEQRLLEVLRRHRDALYEQWQREREKRLRTEF